jgi:hypothetical protein
MDNEQQGNKLFGRAITHRPRDLKGALEDTPNCGNMSVRIGRKRRDPGA